MNKKEYSFVISNLEWERIFLKIEVRTNCEGQAEFYLKNEIGTISVPFPCVIKEGKYLFTLNMAAVSNRSFLENGKWQLVAVTNNQEYICQVESQLAKQFDALSRVFRYGKQYAYTVTFDVETKDDIILEWYMESVFMVQNNGWKKRNYVKEASSGKEFVKNLLKTMLIVTLRAEYGIFHFFHVKKGENILFMSETRDFLWGNLKYIEERLKERGLDKKFSLSYSFETAANGTMSPLKWFGIVRKIAKQDYIFVDDYAPVFGFLNLSKRTKLIQVWHAGEGFKAVGYCRFGKEGSPYPAGSCHKQYDYALVGAKRLVKVYAEVFGIEEEAFLPVGMPRLDDFLNQEKMDKQKQRFYEKYPRCKGKKIILFAPTYRGKGQKEAYYPYEWLDLQKIKEMCGDEYVFLVKMHPFIEEKMVIPKDCAEYIFDVSSEKDINSMYYVTDLLITDYSSNYYEYALLQKPVLFFVPDREIYEVARGIHKEVKKTAPGKVCDTFEDMIEAIKSKDFEMEKLHRFIEENFAHYGGNASDKVIDEILLS